ncbi:MAG: hypothetical protein M1818_004883 [Claussenomyces sp. TS43310]|nr:MAG: hypothetical protein M1818_004883 [Claussenomyces sp. TS43310]
METADEIVKKTDAALPRVEEPRASSEGRVEFFIDPIKEKKLLRKLDLAFTPIIMLLYLSCFLDRSNIGNVKVAGIIPDIHATSEQFSTAVSIFYASYVAFETPAPVLMKIVTPRIMLTVVCAIWSLTTIFTGLVSNIGGLYATRLVLGACEAGLFPCLNLYLTMVYKREEMAKRVSYLFVCAALSGAFGGLLAYALLQMNGVAGYAGWRWVYIIEGIFSILCVFVVWFGLPNDPSTSYFLTAEQKDIMTRRNEQRAQYMGNDHFEWKELQAAFADPKLYLSGVIQFCQDILLYGFSTFLPSILKAMNYNTLESNYLTIPVYLFGGLVFIFTAMISDKYGIRGPMVFLANFFGIAGYIVLITVKDNGIKYFATYLCAMAVYVGPGLNLTWLNVNVAPHYRRATAIGFQQSMGNSAGAVAGQIYRTAPYKLGNSFSLGALGLSQVFILVQYFYLKSKNVQKVKIASGAIPDNRRIKTGDEELDFVYHL